MSTKVEHVDVVIVGARCAGAATAVPLARAGRKVVVVEKGRFPSDTLSTHVLVANGVQELQAMGALDKILALGPSRSRYLTLREGDLEIRERFRPFAATRSTPPWWSGPTAGAPGWPVRSGPGSPIAPRGTRSWCSRRSRRAGRWWST